MLDELEHTAFAALAGCDPSRFLWILNNDMQYFRVLMDDAREKDDPDVYCYHSEQFHITADRIMGLTGHDPREGL